MNDPERLHPVPAKAVLVLGMHRGGTSAVAGVLQALGVRFGDALMPASEGVNNKGFFEHIGAFEIHERLLASLGRSRFDPRQMPVGWREHPAFRTAVDEVCALVQAEFRDAALFAVKDPRMCRLVPVWLEALARMAIAPHAIVVVRHPAEVARSMRAQGWVASTARSNLCWLQHMLEAERWTRSVPRTLLTYDALLEDWRAEVVRIGNELAVEWPRLAGSDADTAGAAIGEFLDPRERRYVQQPAAVAPASPPRDAATADIQPLAAQFLAACVAPQRGPAMWQRLAAIGDRYADAAASFGPCLDEAIVEVSLVRLESGQGRTAALAPIALDAVEVRWCGDGDEFPAAAAVTFHLDRRGAAMEAEFDLPLVDRPARLRVDLGESSGAFRLDALRVDGEPVADLARRARAADPRSVVRAYGVAPEAFGSARNTKVELDLSGLLRFDGAPRAAIAFTVRRLTDAEETTLRVAAAFDAAVCAASAVARTEAANLHEALAALRSSADQAARAEGDALDELVRHAAGQAQWALQLDATVSAQRADAERQSTMVEALAEGQARLAGKLDALLAADASRFRWRDLFRGRRP